MKQWGWALAAAISLKASAQSDTTVLLKNDSSWLSQKVQLWNKQSSKADYVGAAGSIYNKDVNSTPVADVTNLMAGRIAGLYTLQLSGMNGADAAAFYLRGRTPIIVIDGVVRSFTNFNPDEIESITVLKDALATAMYGQRAANGAIVITTRNAGKHNFEINASAQAGVMDFLYKPKLANAFQYATLYNEAQENMTPGSTPRYTQDELAAWANHTNDPYAQPDVNWYDEIIKQNPLQQRYNISLAGKSSNYHYFTSLEHFAQGGNFITSPSNSYSTNNDYKRYNIRTNAAVAFNKDIELTLNVFGSLATGYQPGVGTVSLANNITSTPQTAYPVYNADGSYGGNSQWTNNLHAGAVSSGYLVNTERTIAADMALKYKLDDFVNGLWVKGQLSMNNYYLEMIDRSKSFAVYQPDDANPGEYIRYGENGLVDAGTAEVNSQIRQSYYNAMIGYDRSWKSHQLNLLATYNVDNNINNFTELDLQYKNLGLNASYNWNKTYFAELGLNYGAMNRYEPGKRGAVFPSLGLGWVLSNMPFFHPKNISYLKIRASVGQSAWGDPNSYFAYLQNFTIGTTGYNVGETNSNISGVEEARLVNKGITWEKALKLNIGVDASFYDGQLSLTADYYRNKYSDELMVRGQNSGIMGIPFPEENIGESRYSGFEASVNFSPKTSGAFKYFVNANFSAAKNTLLYNGNPQYPYSWLNRTGHPVGQSFGLVADGFYQESTDITKTANWQGYTPQPGDIMYKDLNGDGVINALDQQAIGTEKPLLYYGLSAGFSFKGLDFSFLVQGVNNRNFYLGPNESSAFYNGYGNVLEMHMDRWTPANNVNAAFPRLSLGTNINNNQTSTFWMRSGDYIRLKNVEIGYNFKSLLFPHGKIRTLRLFMNGYNLLTWKKDEGDFDPESRMSIFSNQRIINGGITLGL